MHCIDLFLGFDSLPNPSWSRSAARTYSMSINHLGSGGSFDARQKRLRRIADVIGSGRFFDKKHARRREELRAHQ